ncbi:coiled-coil domain-containing protein [Chloroflexota bacterium]
METKVTDFAKLNEAVERFGSLQKANARLEKDKLALEKGNAQLKQENKNLAATRDKLAGQVEDINTKKEDYQSQLQSLSNQIKVHGYQYELFCGFMAMVAESPSVNDSLKTLVASLQKLIDSGWHISKNADEMRSLFIRTVMGDYLKCYRCGSCGAKFITNKEPKYKFFGNGYYCPACHNWYAVKEDNSFLKALVSEKQLEDTLHLEKVMEEYEVLEPFKAFLEVPCEICHEPITEWSDYGVKLAIQGVGCGHTACWHSESGQMKELFKAIQKFKEDMK